MLSFPTGKASNVNAQKGKDEVLRQVAVDSKPDLTSRLLERVGAMSPSDPHSPRLPEVVDRISCLD